MLLIYSANNLQIHPNLYSNLLAKMDKRYATSNWRIADTCSEAPKGEYAYLQNLRTTASSPILEIQPPGVYSNISDRHMTDARSGSISAVLATNTY